MSNEVIDRIKTILIAAVFAALGYIVIALGADPVLNADPVMGGFVGAIAGLLTRFLRNYEATDDVFAITPKGTAYLKSLEEVEVAEPVLIRDTRFRSAEEVDPGSIPGAR